MIKPAPEMIERKFIGPRIDTLNTIIMNLSTLSEAMKAVADDETVDPEAYNVDWLLEELRRLHDKEVCKALSIFEEITRGHYWGDWTCREEYGPENFPAKEEQS